MIIRRGVFVPKLYVFGQLIVRFTPHLYGFVQSNFEILQKLPFFVSSKNLKPKT
jgi:hypothetical protein